MTNPLLAPSSSTEQLPAFDRILPEHVVPAITELVATVTEGLAEVESSAGTSFDDVIEPVNDLLEHLGRAWGVTGHLMGVKNSDALRDAHQAAQAMVVETFMRVSQSRPIFERMLALSKRTDAKLSDVENRILQKRLRDAELSGVSLTGDDKARFNVLEQELSELSTKFSHHVLDATKAFALDLTDEGDVLGIPLSVRAMYAEAAVEKGAADATAEKGPWRVTLDFPSYSGFMRHGQHRGHRESLYMANATRASSGEGNNAPLIDEILRRRQEQAKLLGRATYAALSLQSKMAGEVSKVEALLDDLHQKCVAPARAEEAELDALARTGIPGIDANDDVKAWDLEFLAERLREQKYDFSDEDTRPYFPLHRVLDGMFALVEEIFGIKVRAADGETPVWHKDVRFFRVAENGVDVAAFFLDPYARPSEKRGGAWMDDCVGRAKRKDGSVRLPVAYLVCNGTPPVGKTPSLMSFREVETLFHEFGHGLQHMLTRIDRRDASGINGVEWDAVELPSQFMENFCYDEDTLIGMSGHHETGDKLPRVLFEKILAARTFRAASMMLRQIYFARLDLELHHRYVAGAGEGVFDVQERIALTTLVRQPPSSNRFLAAFTHIFAGGYAAGYYSYKWAEVLAADAFGAFVDAGLRDKTARRDTGKKFRETVLALGGAVHPADVFRAFRGRDPEVDALLAVNGLKAAA